jgi:hypothetical protein
LGKASPDFAPTVVTRGLTFFTGWQINSNVEFYARDFSWRRILQALMAQIPPASLAQIFILYGFN